MLAGKNQGISKERNAAEDEHPVMCDQEERQQDGKARDSLSPDG